MAKLRVGVIGTSGWVQEFHLPILASHPGVDVVAICGRDATRAAEVARRHDVPRVHTDYRELVADDLDAVVVVTPEDLHHPMVMAALSAGRHVLCEKPLALTAAESAEMLAAAEQAGVKHMVQFTNRGLPHYRYLKHLVDDGYVGEPYYMYLLWPTGWGPDQENNTYYWAADAQRSQGAVAELGSHMIDIARWLLGDVASVSAALHSFVIRPDPTGAPMQNSPDSAFLLLDFRSRAQAAMHVGLPNIAHADLRFTGQTVVVSGHDGTLESRCDPWSNPRAPVSDLLGVRRNQATAEALAVPAAYFGAADRGVAFDVFRHQPVGPRLFVDAILEDRAVTPSFADGHEVQRIIDAAVEADRAHAAQPL